MAATLFDDNDDDDDDADEEESIARGVARAKAAYTVLFRSTFDATDRAAAVDTAE